MNDKEITAGIGNAANIAGLAGIVAAVSSFGLGMIWASAIAMITASAVISFIIAKRFLKPVGTTRMYKQVRLGALVFFLAIIFWQAIVHVLEMAELVGKSGEELAGPAMISVLWICWSVGFVAAWVGSGKVKNVSLT